MSDLDAKLISDCMAALERAGRGAPVELILGADPERLREAISRRREARPPASDARPQHHRTQRAGRGRRSVG